MLPDLERLVRLQNADNALRRLDAALAEVPARLAALEAELAEERARLDAARAALAASQKARKQLEGGLQDLETKRSRYKGQLMEVKTNKEYTAMLHEIEVVEREIRSLEDQVLSEMEKAETAAADVSREEKVFKVVEGGHREKRREVEAERARLDQERAEAEKERAEAAGSLEGELLELYQRVAKLRGVAVAEARDGVCQVCHLKLRLQMFVEIKRNDQIRQCPACNRVLYYEPPPPVVSPEP